ncbi:hypothetical protein CEXT_512891 [Caerostris extrusa]|uniref:Uncharacterized protein n=1 Tax=Caerostris extrusa TaxID=172846 RepID=A0AAV4XIS4_CAEEX|nr:hypothetical protein CEXT_512891 [Caerostris extrusa]
MFPKGWSRLPCPKKLARNSFLCPLRPAQNSLPAEKKIRSALEKIASYNVLWMEQHGEKWKMFDGPCKHCGVYSEREIPPPRSPSASRPRKIRK